jgi:hypothetical protein
MDPQSVSVTIRHAFPDDRLSLLKLAALDSADVPPDPILAAEVDGELLAALSLRDKAVIADPFHHTAALVELLRARAAQLERAAAGRRQGRLWPLAVRGLGRRRAFG